MSYYTSLLKLGGNFLYTETRNAVYRTSRVAEALSYAFEHATENDPDSVLRTLDDFSHNHQLLINVGKEKGAFMDKVIKDAKPKIVLELGAYVGYSAVRTARLLPEGSRLISIEKNPLNAAIATKICELAGLQPKVKIIVGDSSDIIPKLKEKYGVDKIDVAFIDHWKDRYLPDIKLIEDYQLLRKGSIVIADNVIFPGTPDYLKYMRNNPDYESSLQKTAVEDMNGLEDGLEVSVRLRD